MLEPTRLGAVLYVRGWQAHGRETVAASAARATGELATALRLYAVGMAMIRTWTLLSGLAAVSAGQSLPRWDRSAAANSAAKWSRVSRRAVSKLKIDGQQLTRSGVPA